MNFTRLRFVLSVATLFLQIGISFQNKEPCPTLPYISLPNGEIIATSPTKLHFKCQRGYFLGGPAQIRCRYGMWTSMREPICLKIEGRCDSPPNIPNADIYGEHTEVGSRVQYMCHPGYTIIGEGNRKCLRSGGWSGITPACLNETEPLEDVATRLEESFVNKISAYSSESIVKARYLDAKSLLKGLELVILVDRSSSVDPVDLETGKKFIKFLLQRFKVRNVDNPIGVRAAILAFGSKVDIIFNINDVTVNNSDTAGRILDAKLQPGGGGTAMVPALIDVFQKVEPFLRKDAKRALFLISDGDPNVGGTDADATAGTLKEHYDFEAFTVGIGRDINKHMLSRIASEPVLDHVFLLENYGNLEEVLKIIKNEPMEVPPPPPKQCGFPTEYNYHDTSPWNAMVFVAHYIESENTTKLRLCGGTLMCSQWVITAASCFHHVDGENVTLQLQYVFVVLGGNNLFIFGSKQHNFYAKEVKIHPDFHPKRELFNNLALIKLNSPAPIEEFRPVCLPPTDATIPMYLNSAVNKTWKAWGYSAPKQGVKELTPTSVRVQSKMARVMMVDDSECKLSVGAKIQGKSIFCASSRFHFCLGNIGTAVIGEDPKTGAHHILGVLSQRHKCDIGFNRFTELTKFVPWINKETEKCHFNHWNAN